MGRQSGAGPSGGRAGKYRATESDKELVRRLMDGDRAAWTDILSWAAGVVARRRSYRERARRFSFTAEEVASQLYLDLSEKNCGRLREYRFDSAFTTFLWCEIRTAVRTLERKILGRVRVVLSPDGPGDDDGPGADDFADTRRLGDGARGAETSDRLSVIQTAFAAFHKTSPTAAYVLLLRADTGLSSIEVAEFLGLTPANVDQLTHRARKAYAGFLSRAECGSAVL